MATISPVGSWIGKGVHQTVWDGITASTDTIIGGGSPMLGDKSVAVYSQTATGFNSVVITIQGSNDDTPTGNYTDLADAQGNVLTFSANKVEQILENPRWIRPRASGATGGSQSLKVVLISRADPR